MLLVLQKINIFKIGRQEIIRTRWSLIEIYNKTGTSFYTLGTIHLT